VSVAYVVVSFGRPGQVLRLVDALAGAPGAHVLVRHDQRGERLDRREAERRGALWHEDGIRLEWGGWSQLRVGFGALRRAAEAFDPDWVVLLSGQDYPLRPPAEIERGMAAAGADAFLGSVREVSLDRPFDGGPDDEFRLRLAYRHLRAPRRLPHLPNRLRPLAYVRRVPPRLGIRRLRLPYGPRLRPYVSSDWLALGRRGLRTVLGADRALVRFHRGVPVPTEAFYATVLLNDPALTVALDNRRFSSFAGPGTAHPDVLTSADVERAIASGADFARKFDEGVDAGALDLLDRRLRAQAER
jgi:hypothetical protein